MPLLIDTHCHLDFDRFDADRDAVVARAAAAGVTRIIVPALDLANCAAVLSLADQFSGVFVAIGVHPNSAAAWSDEWLAELRAFAAHSKVVAIGEIGLDYHWDHAPAAAQQRALRAQLALAAELALPVIIHNRESSADLLQILAESPLTGRSDPGVLHSFSAPAAVAQRALDLGYYLGFTGPITYKKADELRAVAAMAPADRILVETDAPFLAPQQKRGKRNEPAYVALIAERLALERGVEPTTIAAQTTANAERLFGLPAG